MTVTTSPGDVVAAARVARSALSEVLTPSDMRGSQEEWAQALGELQAVIDTATAAQDAAIVRLAAIEPQVLDDGEVIDTHRALGHVALDAPAIVSGVLTVTAVHAERRVRAAVRMAADGPEGTPTETGLGGLHTAMGAGRLDAYRASVVATELEEAPAEVAASVIAGLEEFLPMEDGPKLRRRVRRMLARISPDLLRQRAVRARSECRLERWVGEPGVDTWHGTFPSEEAAQAWAAIDALAQQYLTDGVCERIDRARAKALTDLVASNATIDVQVIYTTAADTTAATTTATTASAVGTTAGDTAATGANATATPTAAAPGADAPAGGAPAAAAAQTDGPTSVTPATTTSATTDPTPAAPTTTAPPAGPPGTDASTAGAPAAAGRATAERAAALATDAPAAPASTTTDPTAGPPATDAIATALLDADVPAADSPASEAEVSKAAPGDLVEVTGLRPGEPTLVSRAWVDRTTTQPPTSTAATAATAATGSGRAASRPRGKPRVGPAPCDPLTGALLDLAGLLTTPAYRPGKALAALVRARDGHCRFPGCHVAARYCDLDHVTPWPTGPTSAANLVCLCRRHHRIKQRPGWQTVLHLDATMTWTDPTGRTRTTHPIDHLHRLVLPDTGTDPAPISHHPRRVLPDGPHSALEYHLEHTPDPPWTRPRTRCRLEHHRPTARIHLTYTPAQPPRPPALSPPDRPPF